MSDSTHTRARSLDVLLEAVIAIVRELPASAHARELQARASSYATTLRGWEATKPTPAQRGALFDLVSDLHAKALDAKNARRSRVPRKG